MTDPFWLRASSVSDLLDCPLRWKSRNIDGLQTPSTPPALIGTAVHASTAFFDQARMEGAPVSIDDAVEVAIETLRNPEEEIDWMGTTVAQAEATAIRVHVDYCEMIAPQLDFTLVEHTLAPLKIDMGDGVVFELTGTLDRIRQNEYGARGVADVKTGGRVVDPDGEVSIGKHKPQLGVYELLYEQEFSDALSLPSAVIGLHTGSDGRVGMGYSEGAKEALVGDGVNPGILHFIKPMFQTGLFPPNPGSMMCSERYCPIYNLCKYHG